LFSPRHSSLPLLRNSFRYRRRPSRVVLGVAAATVAAGVGIFAGLSVGSGAPAAGHTGVLSAATISGARDGASGASSAAKAAAAKAAAAKAAAARHKAAVHQHRAAAEAASSPRARRSGGTQHPAAAAPVAPRRHAAAAPPKPFLVYDSVTPEAIPGNPVVATYADGPRPDSPAMVAGRAKVIWISITGLDPNASALDIEPGCASPSQAAGWVSSRLHVHPHGVAILYTMISDWSAVQANVASLPSWMKSHIRWWIADPTGTPHIVPGSQATQWYWGPSYDISTALPGF